MAKIKIPYLTGNAFFSEERKEFINENILNRKYELEFFIWGQSDNELFEEALSNSKTLFIDDLFCAEGGHEMGKALEFIGKIKKDFPLTKIALIQDVPLDVYLKHEERLKGREYIKKLTQIYESIDTNFILYGDPSKFEEKRDDLTTKINKLLN